MSARPENWEQMDRSARKEWCHKHKVIDWSIHTRCPEHGLKHLWVTDFFHTSQTGACAHPLCISKQLSALRYDPRCGKLLRFADKVVGRDIIVEEFIDAMMDSVKKGRPTVAHGGFIRWVALAALKRVQKIEKREAQQLELKEAIIDYLNDDVGSAIDVSVMTGDTRAFGAKASHNGQSPQKLLEGAELYYHVAEEFGPHYLLWLVGEISVRDVAKIEGIKTKEVELVVPKVKKWYLKHFGKPDLTERSSL